MPCYRFAGPLVALVLLALSDSSAFAAEQPLRVLAWPGYADADMVKVFEKRYDVQVEVSFVSSDDVMREKLGRAQGGDYDVFAANTAEMQHYIEQGLVQPLRLEHLPNTVRQLKRFRDLAAIPGASRDGKAYAVPFTYSEMGLIYDRKQWRSPPTSLASLWDPTYQGRVLAFDTSSHNFSIASLALGGAPFAIKDADFPAVSEKLIALRRNVLTFYTLPEEVVSLFKEHSIALVYANYGRQQLKQLVDAGADVGYVIPREGALAWLDCWAVSRGARDPLLAEQWINYNLEPSVSREFSRRQGLANTLELPATSSYTDTILWLEPVEDAARRAHLWARIVSGYRPQALLAP
ncbi:MAG: extracellular solute-binding protein [Pseudomonas sp.]|uniref:extracellular solute-binding protein n=1 Tax=Pseudomonas sp. TaxID=306 RepID=UPI0033907AFF